MNKAILLIVCISLFLSACNTSISCNKVIICDDGREFPSESYNEETGKCEVLFFAGGNPCFDGSRVRLCEGDEDCNLGPRNTGENILCEDNVCIETP